ncbi:hypothetical protein LDFHOB_05820 [Candidatus Electronema aureum]
MHRSFNNHAVMRLNAPDANRLAINFHRCIASNISRIRKHDRILCVVLHRHIARFQHFPLGNLHQKLPSFIAPRIFFLFSRESCKLQPLFSFSCCSAFGKFRQTYQIAASVKNDTKDAGIVPLIPSSFLTVSIKRPIKNTKIINVIFAIILTMKLSLSVPMLG